MHKLADKLLSAGAVDFIDEPRLNELLAPGRVDPGRTRAAIDKSLAKTALTAAEAADLINATDPDLVEEIFAAARRLKQEVYGNRIVLFAPLYIGNECVNDCAYCAFRRSNRNEIRRTLSLEEIRQQVTALENQGHKRLILVYGEHPRYDADFIHDTVCEVYATRAGHGQIRRVNINAAPLDVPGYRRVKEAGIGTYQVFQETYHHETYAAVHPPQTRKGDYLYRLDALSRAQQGGIDDVGIGVAVRALRLAVSKTLALVHARHCTSRIASASGRTRSAFHALQPALRRARSIHRWTPSVRSRFQTASSPSLRLAVPYTGLILTAREPCGDPPRC